MERLYKYDYSGRLRVWWVEVDSSGTAYRTHAGIDGGSIVVSDWTHVSGNQQRPDPIEQCTFEVQALYRNRLARTYHQTAEGAKTGAHFFEPMLAQPLDRSRLWYLHPEYDAGQSDLRPLLYIQPKLDGMRCIVSADGMFSRKGKEIISAPHISEALKPFFEAHPDAMLDGELYGSQLADNFQMIMSLARKTKPTPADLELSKKWLQLHLYDAPSLEYDPYVNRYALCGTAAEMATSSQAEWDAPVIAVVETVGITAWDQWDAYHARWCSEGFEGSMGRVPDAAYQKRRTHDLVKRKDFITAEFQCAELLEGEGNWAGACKGIRCWLPIVPYYERVPATISDATTFIATPRGSYASMAKLLQNGTVPKEITGRYLGWTTTDIPKPRHCIAIDIHMEGRHD